MVLAYRDRPVTAGQVGRELGASHVLSGSLRRAGNRLRINAQLVDAMTDFPTWSERYDREMEDVFAVQDEIASKIAAALRITLTPQEQEALAAKPTENLQAYDLYLRGRNYARRVVRQNLQFALQMYENAVALDPNFALAHAGIANVCAQYFTHYEKDESWIERAKSAAQRASASGGGEPEVLVAEAWIDLAEGRNEAAIEKVRAAIKKDPDVDGGFYLLGRALFVSGRFQEIVDNMETALAHSGENYNVTVTINNALGALGKKDALQNFLHRQIAILESHIRKVPEDARARVLMAAGLSQIGRYEEAKREADIAVALRPDDTMVLYNVACVLCLANKPDEAMVALRKSKETGNRSPAWVRQDPDLAILRGRPDFEELYPEENA